MARKKIKIDVNVNVLPTEIIENILLRVPVKTILRFMSVCKSWRSIFLSPYFINLHLKINKSNHDYLLLVPQFKDPLIVTDTSSVVVHSRLVLDPKLDYTIQIGGSCDGIVCVQGLCRRRPGVYNEHIYLCNPALRVAKKIKRCKWHIGEGKSFHSEQAILGFGFDIHSKDYKVIRFQKYDVTVPTQVEIYSLSSDSWRIVKVSVPNNIIDFFAGSTEWTSGVCFNGVHHWGVAFPTIRSHKYYYSVAIISFDMGEEMFKKSLMPSKCKTRDICTIFESLINLFNYHESLAMLIFNKDNRNYDIWVMSDYGTLSESWTKLYKIESKRCGFFRGFIKMKNEVIFARIRDSGHRLEGRLVYDLDNSKVCRYIAKDDLLNNASEIMSFKESLLLLGCDNLIHL